MEMVLKHELQNHVWPGMSTSTGYKSLWYICRNVSGGWYVRTDVVGYLHLGQLKIKFRLLICFFVFCLSTMFVNGQCGCGCCGCGGGGIQYN